MDIDEKIKELEKRNIEAEQGGGQKRIEQQHAKDAQAGKCQNQQAKNIFAQAKAPRNGSLAIRAALRADEYRLAACAAGLEGG